MHALFYDPIFWVLAIIGVFLTGISKSGFAGGAGVVAVPLLSLLISPAIAVVIVLPLLLLMDIQTIAHHRHKLARQELRQLIPAALLGVLLGSFALGQLSDQLLLMLVGSLSLGFAIFQLRKKPKPSAPQKHSPVLGSSMGLIAGITSSLIHAGGPPLNIYLASRRLPPPIWISTAAVFFASINASKVLSYAWAGLWQQDLLVLSLLLIPFGIAGVLAGHHIAKRMNPAVFVRMVMLLLALSGIVLIGKVVVSA